MMAERVFLDTSFVVACHNRGDEHHALALSLLPWAETAQEIWTTPAILFEIGNALARRFRTEAESFIRDWLEARRPQLRLATHTHQRMMQALDLFRARPDKTWGLTDCFSFVVMAEEGLTDALSADEHFRQAGFRPLLLEAA